jgi:hypothetical protein
MFIGPTCATIGRRLWRHKLTANVGALALVAAVALGVVAAGPLAARLSQSTLAPGCAPGQTPEFHLGFAALQDSLGGNLIGSPIECEHVINAQGDTEQRTTTGLARYDAARNVPSFEHDGRTWSLQSDGLILESQRTRQVVISPGIESVQEAAQRNSAPIRPVATSTAKQDALPIADAIGRSSRGMTSAGGALQGR